MTLPSMGRVGLLCTLALIGSGMGAPAQPTPRVGRAILLQAREAAGGPAWDRIDRLHFRGTVRDGMRSGTIERWEDVRAGRFAERVALPPGEEGEGFDGVSPWETSRRSGIAYRRGDVDGRLVSADEAYRVARGYWFAGRHDATIEDAGIQAENGRRFDMLRITPEGGRAFDLWIDQDTHLINRTIEQQAEDLVVSRYGDYRRVGGVMLPFSIRTGDGEDASSDRVQTIQSIEINQAAPERIYSLPDVPAEAISLPAGRDQVELPFRLEANRVVVPLSIGGRSGFEAEFDTGGGLILPPALLGRLGLQADGRLRGSGGGEGSIAEKTGVAPEIGLAGARIGGLVFNSFALWPELPERALVGIEVLQRFVVRLDFDRLVMTLIRPERFAYHGDGAVIPFHFQEGQPEITGSVDGIAGLFTVDTGDSGSLLLLAPFARRYGLAARYHAVLPYRGRAVSATHGVMARVGEVSLDGADGRVVARIMRPVTSISLQHGGFDANADVSANLGLGILKQFNLTFDYRRQVIILERNNLYGRPDVYDRVGLHVQKQADGWAVGSVAAGTPAAEAGLKSGDLIATIDGLTPQQLTLADLYERVRGAVNSHMVLRVGNRTMTLTLRDLL